MTIIDKPLTPGAGHGRPGTVLAPKGITVHYVGNPGSGAEGNRGWFENGAGGAYTSAHYIIGLNGEVLRLIPENERAMHAGKAYKPEYNDTAKTNNASYIGIECCHPDVTGRFNERTYTALVELCADICRRYGFGPQKDIVRHYDITGKICPLYYVQNPAEWERLRGDIAAAAPGCPAELTVRNMQADGVTAGEENRVHWLGYLSGVTTTSPEYVKAVFDRYHEKLAAAK